jgi:hypothetical protein
MDEFLNVLNEVAVILLPILGAIVLFFLALLLYRAAKLLQSLMFSLKTVDHTLEQVDKYVTALEQPVSTVLRVSKGVDAVANHTEHAISKVAKFVMENFEWIKETVLEKFKKTKEGGTLDE